MSFATLALDKPHKSANTSSACTCLYAHAERGIFTVHTTQAVQWQNEANLELVYARNNA